MGLCVFQTNQILPLVQHALSAPETRGAYGGADPGPALFFVHDQGVYLMSNGSPRDEAAVADGTHVAYAEGCNPNVGDFDDWYQTSRDLVGGDDFVEVLPLDDAELFLRNCAEFDEFVVQLTATSLGATFRKRRRPAKRSRARAT